MSLLRRRIDYGLRVYADNDDRGIGLEQTPEAYLGNLVDVFREVARVLRGGGVLWVNMGDSYSNEGGHTGPGATSQRQGRSNVGVQNAVTGQTGGLAHGNLLGIPWRLALALQRDGWILRQDVIWAKRSPMPESLAGTRWEQCRVKVRSARHTTGQADMNDPAMRESVSVAIHDADTAQWSPCPGCEKCRDHDGLVLRRGSWRSTTAHEHIFMFVKSMGYFADGIAAQQISAGQTGAAADFRRTTKDHLKPNQAAVEHRLGREPTKDTGTRNRRSVWTDIRPEPYGEMGCPACGRSFKRRVYQRFPHIEGHPICPRCEEPLQSHFATFPPDLPRICIQASTSEAGCCPRCGAQLARVVEKTYRSPLIQGVHTQEPDTWKGTKARPRQRSAAGTFLPRTDEDRREDVSTQYGVGGAVQRMGDGIDTQTLGFRPTCGHPEATNPVPCRVLDPFAGTFTTGEAAQRLGRHAVGVDLSDAYLKQAVARMQAVPLPLVSTP